LLSRLAFLSGQNVECRAVAPSAARTKLYSDYRMELIEAGIDKTYVTLCEACDWEEDLGASNTVADSVLTRLSAEV